MNDTQLVSICYIVLTIGFLFPIVLTTEFLRDGLREGRRRDVILFVAWVVIMLTAGIVLAVKG